jgi:hypothetical protein
VKSPEKSKARLEQEKAANIERKKVEDIIAKERLE